MPPRRSARRRSAEVKRRDGQRLRTSDATTVELRIHLATTIATNSLIMSKKGLDKPETETKGPPPTGLPPREKLPADFQKIIDKSERDENFYDELYDGA